MEYLKECKIKYLLSDSFVNKPGQLASVVQLELHNPSQKLHLGYSGREQSKQVFPSQSKINWKKKSLP